MCKTKRKTDAIDSKPKPKPDPITVIAINDQSIPSTTRTYGTDSTNPITELTRCDSSKISFSSTSTSTAISSRGRSSLPPNPNIYSFSEISSATNNFLSNRLSSSSWRCSLHGADSVVVHRQIRRPIPPPRLHHLLSRICKSHHISVAPLLGAAISGGRIYLVYAHVVGANLADCLRNPKNPNFSPLSSWISRMQIAIDVAQGLEYVHHYTGLDLHLVHNHIRSSSIIVTEPSFNAKICYFGVAALAGEIRDEEFNGQDSKMMRLDSLAMKVEGTRGYMSPDISTAGIVSQKSDVFAFGVVMLELVSGEEPLRYRYDEKVTGFYERFSVIERAREAVERGRVRQWLDWRLRDSFPMDVADKMTRVALECVHVEPDQRPDMRRVAGKISKLYLQSRAWSESMGVPTDIITASFAPR